MVAQPLVWTRAIIVGGKDVVRDRTKIVLYTNVTIALSESCRNFIDIVSRHDYRNYIDKISNQFVNIYKG